MIDPPVDGAVDRMVDNQVRAVDSLWMTWGQHRRPLL